MLEGVLSGQRVWTGFAAIMALAVVGGLSWWGYSAYTISKNQKAQWAFAQELERFTEAMQQGATSDKWREIAEGFSKAFEGHKGSSLAPVMMAYQADAMMRGGDVLNACRTLKGAVDMMGKSYPLYFYYAVKSQVWNLDHADQRDRESGQAGPAVDVDDIKNTRGSACGAIAITGPENDPYLHRKQAIDALKALAQDGKNPDPGLAWYHLWQYATVHRDRELREMAFAKLQGMSDWSSLVQEPPSLVKA